MNRSLYALALAPLAVACAADPLPPPVSPGSDTASAQADAQPTDVQSLPGKDAGRADIHISDRIRQACGIGDTEAFFAYNSARVEGPSRTVLKKLADCFTTGPLKGEGMMLVGHADPRGDEEYNLTLGGQRADNVKKTLGTLGLAAKQVTTTSRGEMDAEGTDESSWAKDRKVEVMVKE